MVENILLRKKEKSMKIEGNKIPVRQRERRWKDGWTEEQPDQWIDGQLERQANEQTNIHSRLKNRGQG